jgi:hypothetical protein
MSCVTAGITGAWKDENYNKPLTKVLVIGLSDNKARRLVFEDALVAQFEQNGIAAESSLTLFSTTQKLERKELKDFIQKNSFDAVVMTRLISVEIDSTMDDPGTYSPKSGYVRSPRHYRPPHDYYYNLYEYYRGARPAVYSTEYTEDVDTLLSGTNTYDYEYEYEAEQGSISSKYIEDVVILLLETNLYETEQEKLIWSMSSESFNLKNVNTIIQQLSKLIVKRLSKDGLI